MSEELPKACCSEKTEAPKRICECRHKATERSAEFQSELQKRLNRAIGQLNGVKSMIEDNRYCGDVLIQLSAVESAVSPAKGGFVRLVPDRSLSSWLSCGS